MNCSHQQRRGLLSVVVWPLMISLLGGSGLASAKELVLATSKSIPPYIVEETGSGIQLERVKQAFAYAGHTIKQVIFTSNKRAELLLSQKKVDAVINAPSASKSMFFSDPVIHYQNVAVSLGLQRLSVDNIADLSKYRVWAFQNATKYLGDSYRQAIAKSPLYEEAATQMVQLHKLYQGQADVIVLDRRIFEHYNALYEQRAAYPQPTRIHYVFDRAPRTVGFYDDQLRDEFNQGLQQLLAQPPELAD